MMTVLVFVSGAYATAVTRAPPTNLPFYVENIGAIDYGLLVISG